MNRNRVVMAAVSVIAIVIVVAALWILLPRQSDALTPLSLRLPIPVADTAFAPYYLAVDRGIFEQHGLDVTIEPGSSEMNPVRMVAQGADQFAIVGGPELLLSGRSRGAPVVGLIQVHKDSDFVVLLTHPDAGISQLSDLAGRQVGFFYGHISTDVLHMLFKKEGVSVDEVDVGFDYSQFLTGRLAAQWAFRTTAAISLAEQGVDLGLISPADYGLVTQGHFVITSEQVIQSSPEVVQRFVDAVLDAMQYTLDHPDEAVAATRRRDPAFSETVGRKQLAVYLPAMERNQPLGTMSPSDILTTMHQMQAAALLPEDFSLNSSIDGRFVDQYHSK